VAKRLSSPTWPSAEKLKQLFIRALYLFVLIGFLPARADSYVEFFRALQIDNESSVSSLLERGFDPNSVSQTGDIALALAIKEGADKVARRLLAQPGIEIDRASARGETALMMAAISGRLDWVERLVARGAAVNRPGWTPLHYAASGPDPRIVARLVELGAAIDARSPNDSTPLMLAAGYGDQRNALVLLGLGADPSPRNARGLSAADFARQAGHDPLAEQLEAAAARRGARR
jgi:ankyrin repeat protein